MNIEIQKGKQWTFCKHYPEGFQEPFECLHCGKESQVFEVVEIVNNIQMPSITFALPNNEIEVCEK